MSKKKARESHALVLLDNEWVKAGQIDFFLGHKHRHPEGADPEARPICFVFAIEINVEDGWFLEMRVRPLEDTQGELRIFVPKQHVIAVIEGDRIDAPVPGFGRS